eukprot:GHVN01041600.1.p1 GENE.GHVN01041600.1~~GHVN01041600.1.p1  ORF type:complete len:1093 (+),score=121.52 GHVN01041600.1:128-3406(+)
MGQQLGRTVGSYFGDNIIDSELFFPAPPRTYGRTEPDLIFLYSRAGSNSVRIPVLYISPRFQEQVHFLPSDVSAKIQLPSAKPLLVKFRAKGTTYAKTVNSNVALSRYVRAKRSSPTGQQGGVTREDTLYGQRTVKSHARKKTAPSTDNGKEGRNLRNPKENYSRVPPARSISAPSHVANRKVVGKASLNTGFLWTSDDGDESERVPPATQTNGLRSSPLRPSFFGDSVDTNQLHSPQGAGSAATFLGLSDVTTPKETPPKSERDEVERKPKHPSIRPISAQPQSNALSPPFIGSPSSSLAITGRDGLGRCLASPLTKPRCLRPVTNRSRSPANAALPVHREEESEEFSNEDSGKEGKPIGSVRRMKLEAIDGPTSENINRPASLHTPPSTTSVVEHYHERDLRQDGSLSRHSHTSSYQGSHATSSRLLTVLTGVGRSGPPSTSSLSFNIGRGGVPSPSGSNDGVSCVLYFHANATDIGEARPRLQCLSNRCGVNFLVFEYPGYGLLDVYAPTAKGVDLCALAAFRFLTDTLGYESSSILLYGRSIGCGPAAQLASNVATKRVGSSCGRVGGLILHSPYSSLSEIAEDFVPLSSWVLQTRQWHVLECVSRAAMSATPLMIIHGQKDEIINWRHGRKLARCSSATGRLKHTHFPEQADHNCFDFEFDMVKPLTLFLATVKSHNHRTKSLKRRYSSSLYYNSHESRGEWEASCRRGTNSPSTPLPMSSPHSASYLSLTPLSSVLLSPSPSNASSHTEAVACLTSPHQYQPPPSRSSPAMVLPLQPATCNHEPLHRQKGERSSPQKQGDPAPPLFETTECPSPPSRRTHRLHLYHNPLLEAAPPSPAPSSNEGWFHQSWRSQSPSDCFSSPILSIPDPPSRSPSSTCSHIRAQSDTLEYGWTCRPPQPIICAEMALTSSAGLDLINTVPVSIPHPGWRNRMASLESDMTECVTEPINSTARLASSSETRHRFAWDEGDNIAHSTNRTQSGGASSRHSFAQCTWDGMKRTRQATTLASESVAMEATQPPEAEYCHNGKDDNSGQPSPPPQLVNAPVVKVNDASSDRPTRTKPTRPLRHRQLTTRHSYFAAPFGFVD